MRDRVLRWFPPLGVLVGCIAVWQVWVTVGHVESWILPPPGEVFSALWDNRTAIAHASWTTLGEAVIGLLIGTTLGIAIALVMQMIPGLIRAVSPVIVTSQTIPIVVLAPLVAVWFGYGIMPKIVLVALISFFPVTVAATSGMTGVDPSFIELLRSFGANRWVVLRKVRIPGAIAPTFAGLRIAAAYAIGSAVIGEYVGGTSGLGIFIDQSHRSYRTDQMLAAVIVIAAQSIALFAVVGMVQRRCTPWESPSTRKNSK